MRQLFDTGQSLFRQGDPSDFAVLILSGSADVLREVGDDAIVLGQVHAGEFVGEMGVLEGQPRSATVRAASPVEAELIERQAFLDRVSGDPDAGPQAARPDERTAARRRCHPCRPLRRQGQRRGRRTGSWSRRPPARGGALGRAGGRHRDGPLVDGRGSGPIVHLPFTVGRQPGGRELPSAIAPDLAIREPAPHRLSRAHFSLIVRDGEVLVRDLNSWLGTIVNDRPLGRSFPRDSAPLHKGENTLIAGGKGSPFVFTLTLP